MEVKAHRVWRYAAVAWITLVAVQTCYAVIRWQMGLGRDPDMSGVSELIVGLGVRHRQSVRQTTDGTRT
jgi:hypothetical protein